MQAQISPAALSDCLPALRRFALQLTRNEDRANDLVQDSVERALRKAHLFDGRNLRSWMFTICRRVFLNQIRSAKAKGVSVELDDAMHSRLATAESQEEIMHCNEVIDAFQRLPLNDKTIISLVVMEGLRYEEAAALLDIPVGTVRSRLSRARARLLEMVGGESLVPGTAMAVAV